MKVLAFIPARGGSKGIPRKNLAIVGGKTLLQRAIESVKGCSRIDRIFLSSDDEEILSAGRALGVYSDYRRPPELSGDKASLVDTVIHALDWLAATGERYDIVVLLQPTSPLRSAEDVAAAMEKFLAMPEARTLVSVHRMREHPFECLQGDSGNWGWLGRPTEPIAGRQDYPDSYYFVNGAIYIASVEFIRRKRQFIETGTAMLYVMPQDRGVDIDDPDQLQFAEWLLTKGDIYAE